MSYCRTSCDDFTCELYVWATSDSDVMISVADRRVVLSEPMPPPLEDFSFSKSTEDQIREYNIKEGKRDEEVARIVKNSKVVPIGLSRDGKIFSCHSYEEAADLVQSLKNEGYRVQQNVVERLRSDGRHLRELNKKKEN